MKKSIFIFTFLSISLFGKAQNNTDTNLTKFQAKSSLEVDIKTNQQISLNMQKSNCPFAVINYGLFNSLEMNPVALPNTPTIKNNPIGDYLDFM